MTGRLSALSPRERTVLAAGVAAAALLLFIAFAWIPLERSRARLATEVPQLRGSIARLELQALEAQRLRALPARTTATNGTPLAALEASGLPGARIAATDARHVRLTAADVSFASLLEWLANVEGAQGLHVERARIEALPLAGRVRADLTLARP